MNIQALVLIVSLFLGTLIVELAYEAILYSVKENHNKVAIAKAVRIFVMVAFYYFILFLITRSLVYIDISNLIKNMMWGN